MCSSLVWGLVAPFIAIAMGVAGIVVSAVMYTEPDFSFLLTTNVQYGMVVLLTIFSVLSLAAGALGICGVFQYKKSTLTAFWVLMLVCMLGFAATGAVGLALPLSFQTEGCLGSSYPGIGFINNQTTLAYNRFCKQLPINCTCYLKQNSTFYSQLPPNTLSNSTANYTYPINVLQCPAWVAGFYDNQIGAYQRNFNCSGWCVKNPYYLFSDVNRGIPERSCFQGLSNWFRNYSQYAYIAGFIFVGVCITLIAWMCTYQYFCIREDLQYFTALSATMIT